jgi:DNA repair exonuclease SbcCD ATPase subunit
MNYIPQSGLFQQNQNTYDENDENGEEYEEGMSIILNPAFAPVPNGSDFGVLVEANRGQPQILNLDEYESKSDQLVQLEQEIEARKRFLWETQQQLQNIESQNELLGDVKQDYSQYNSYIVNENQRQIEAMTMLTEYLENLKEQGTLSAENLKDAEQEQAKLKKELQNLTTRLTSMSGLISSGISNHIA